MLKYATLFALIGTGLSVVVEIFYVGIRISEGMAAFYNSSIFIPIIFHALDAVGRATLLVFFAVLLSKQRQQNG